jgi:hypothetical protein
MVLCAGALSARLFVGAHITDDAYITMRYSRNINTSRVMSYNPPDAVLGTSTPLWTFVLAGGGALGVGPEKTALVVSSAADLASIALIAASPVGASLPAIAAAATIAAWPAYVTYAVSGMETSLYVAALVWFVSSVKKNQIVAAAIAASAAALARPDGALVVLLGIGWAWWIGAYGGAFKFGGIVALLCLPWTVYAFARFGSVIPASVVAKSSAHDPWTLSFQNLYAYFSSGPYVWITLLALLGFIAIIKSGDAFWRMWALWAWCYTAAMAAANGFTHFPWYFVPLLPIYTAAAALAVEGIASRAQRVRRIADAPLARAAIAAALMVVLLGRMPALKRYLDSTASGRETLYASVAAQLAAIDPHCTIAATEIGTIGYYYPGRVLDLVGLVSPEVLGRPVGAVLAESRARWLVSYDTHFDRSVAASDGFSSTYARRSSMPVGPARSLEVYERRHAGVCR